MSLSLGLGTHAHLRHIGDVDMAWIVLAYPIKKFVILKHILHSMSLVFVKVHPFLFIASNNLHVVA